MERNDEPIREAIKRGSIWEGQEGDKKKVAGNGIEEELKTEWITDGTKYEALVGNRDPV